MIDLRRERVLKKWKNLQGDSLNETFALEAGTLRVRDSNLLLYKRNGQVEVAGDEHAGNSNNVCWLKARRGSWEVLLADPPIPC